MKEVIIWMRDTWHSDAIGKCFVILFPILWGLLFVSIIAAIVSAP